MRFLDKEENGARPERIWSVGVLLPNMIPLPDFVSTVPDARPDLMVWVVPSDDTHHRLIFSTRSSDPGRVDRFTASIKQNGKDPWELTDEERQRFPGDGEAQGSQGPITRHSEETLATTDRGVVLLRRLLKAMVDDVAAGRDPVGVSRTDGPPRRIEAGLVTVSAMTSEEPAAVPVAGA